MCSAGLAVVSRDVISDEARPVTGPSLAAEMGVAVFKVAFAHWVSEPGQPDLPGILRESMDEMTGVLADRAAYSPPSRSRSAWV